METFIAVMVLALIAALISYILCRLHTFEERYVHLMGQLAINDNWHYATDKTLDNHSEAIADLEGKVIVVGQPSNTGLSERRKEELDKRRNEFKELREVFEHTVTEAAQHMKISKSTAKRYERWRVANSNQ